MDFLKAKFLKIILLSTLLVGTLDIIAAVSLYVIQSGKKPDNVLKFIASGIFGKEAFTAGVSMVFWGLAIHFCIAFSFTFFFFIVYPALANYLKNKIALGAVFGIFTWIVMNLLVLPLTNIPKMPFDSVQALLNVLILIIAIGIPLSWMASTYFNSK
jgi:uncharacterized membrane protein YagU involved in acid resistance